MSKNNDYQKLQKSWNRHPETQRAAEKRFYDTTDETMRHKKKNDKKRKERSDHKHLYVDAVIYKTYYDGSKKPYNGKVCSICGKQHSKNWMICLRADMGRKELCMDGLPLYEEIDENTAMPIKTEGVM
jgi:hypothetical protein